MKAPLKKMALSLLAVFGALVLFGFLYFRFAGALTQNDRKIVSSKMAVCRAAYLRAGPSGLHDYINGETSYERESGFVIVFNADKQSPFSQFPQNEKELSILRARPDIAARNIEWMVLPSNEPHEVWTIKRSTLPDGATMLVGCMTQSRRDALKAIQL
jgi:hypothetical protein